MSQVLIINPILYTPETNRIPQVESIKDTMIYTLCLGFVKAGHQVTLLAAQDYKPVVEEVYDFPVIFMKTIGHKVFQPRCFPYMPGLRGFLKQHREYDLIIASEVFGTWSYTASRLYPEKTIIWHELAKHNNILHKIPSKVWYNIIARFMMRKSLVVPRSEAAACFISQFVPHVWEHFVDHGVNIDKIPLPEQIEKQNRFVVVSQFIERKQIDKTILRFQEFWERGHKDYKLYVIGRGELEETLKQLVKKQRLEEAVSFCGWMKHERLLPFVAESKAMLVSTIKDDNMVSIVESIAAGTPVVTTSIPYTAAYIKRDNLGIVADNWGADELEEICDKNGVYTQNCIAYREKLSNTYIAKQLLACQGWRKKNNTK
ncbi:MAG: glycosyltransferase [Bacillus sp. (in: Bacteria)]|nr:glycosyltransferase [Bacillus sp. (in: firmicutes)]MCM1426147.1 glycosyltransferase [Eubacterium sp.]